jgi:hypothetical protein
VSWEPGKPSQNENEYFARLDEEWKKARRAELNAKRAAEVPAAAPVKSLTCPRCGGTLVEKSVHHVTVDVCSSCKGVWLDHGEMEMLASMGRGELHTVLHEIGGKTR